VWNVEIASSVILLTSGENTSAGSYRCEFERAGFAVTFHPVLSFGSPASSNGTLQQALSCPARYAGLIVTSPRAAQALVAPFAALTAHCQAAWHALPVYAPGRATGDALRLCGLVVLGEVCDCKLPCLCVLAFRGSASPVGPVLALYPPRALRMRPRQESGGAQALAELIAGSAARQCSADGADGAAAAARDDAAWRGSPPRPLLFLCGDTRRDELPTCLAQHSVPLEELVVYTSSSAATCDAVMLSAIPAPLASPAWLVFFSPRGVQAALDGRLHLRWPGARRAAIGPTTAEALAACAALGPAHAVAVAPNASALCVAILAAGAAGAGCPT
jgi:uroporphyrinogen-III synthase